MRRSWLLVTIIIIIVSEAVFLIMARHLTHRQSFLYGFASLIVAVCFAAFISAKEAKMERGALLNTIGNIAQLIGLIGTAFGYYYANHHPQLFIGYGIFLASWLLMFSFLYIKLRKKGYRLLKRRVNPDADASKQG